MQKMPGVDVLYPLDELIGDHKRRFERKFAIA
jgi:hypothetical protein